jgi:cytochrome c-type biogenesis protein CcmE
MAMNLRLAVGSALILGAFAVVAVVAYFGNQELYLTVDELVADPALYAAAPAPSPGIAPGAADSSLGSSEPRRLQVRGHVDYATVRRLREGLELRFTLRGKDESLPVVYAGLVPDTFDRAESVTVAGVVGADGTFVADDLVVQCPSKYEAATPGAVAGGEARPGADDG